MSIYATEESPDLTSLANAIMGLEGVVHGPSRLAVLTILYRTGGASYLSIHRLTGLSMSNLSQHLARLEKAQLVYIGKHFEEEETGHYGEPDAEGLGDHRGVLAEHGEHRSPVQRGT